MSKANNINIKNNNLHIGENPLGYEKIPKLLLKFSLPAIIGMTINSLYNVIDRVFIGNAPDLGSNGLAAITICFPIMLIIMAVGLLLGQGGATLFAIKLGQGKNEDAKVTLGNATLLAFICGVVIFIFGELTLDKLLYLFGASDVVLPYAKAYLRVIFIGSVFQTMAMQTNNFLRADGKPMLSMIAMFIGAGLNIILDPIFIFVFKMGMTGAALATLIAQAVSLIWNLYYFLQKSNPNRIRLPYLKLNKNIISGIISLGMPIFCVQMAGSLLSTVLNKSLLFYGGDLAVSGMGIVNSVQALLILPIIGLNQGLQPISSFNYGAKKLERTKAAVKLTILIATIMAIFGFLLAEFFAVEIVSMFNQEPELVSFGSRSMKIWFMFMPLIGAQIIAANFFQTIERPKISMFLSLSRQVLILLPAVILLGKIGGLNLILFAGPISDFISFTLTFIIFIKFIKNFE